MRSRLAFLIFTLSIALASAVAAQTPGNGATAIATGDEALVKFDLKAATAAYREAFRASPESYEAAWKLARALADQATLSTQSADQEKLCNEAAAIARKAVALNSDDTKGHVYLAVALGKAALFAGGKRKVQLGREVQAEATLALSLNPKDDVAHHVLALWNRELAELSGFLKAFARILYGKLPDASLDAAIQNLKQAIDARPEVIAHHVELGITLAATKSWAESAAELEKALQLPTGWVTDDYYRALARKNLESVRRKLK